MSPISDKYKLNSIFANSISYGTHLVTKSAAFLINHKLIAYTAHVDFTSIAFFNDFKLSLERKKHWQPGKKKTESVGAFPDLRYTIPESKVPFTKIL